MNEFLFFQKEAIIKALIKMANEDLEKVPFEPPFSNIYLYQGFALSEEKKSKAMKITIEDEDFYIL